MLVNANFVLVSRRDLVYKVRDASELESFNLVSRCD